MPLLDTDRELARDSYYAATARREQVFPALAGDAHCDVAIVGGGLTVWFHLGLSGPTGRNATSRGTPA